MITRILVAAPLALALAAAFVGAAVPAYAAPSQAVCETTPGQLRAAGATAPAGAQQKAAILISTGEHLCADQARGEAAKKFAAAARILNVDLASLGSTPVVTAGQ
jgi:hypothetical protein